MKYPSVLEPLEARIAPAATIANPLFDVVAATGQTGVTIDLDAMLDSAASFRTRVELVTNFTMSGTSSPAVITLELFDDKAPLNVANFLRYVQDAGAAND